MKIKSTLLIMIGVCSLSCTSKDDEPVTTDPTGLIKNNVIVISSIERDYDLFVPTSQENSAIVILLHGGTSNSDDITGESGNPAPNKKWLSIAEQNNLILIIPNGLVGSSGNTGWNDCRTDAIGNPNEDDVLFIQSTIEKLKETYTINEQQVYAMGTSNGGHLAIRLAQEIPNQITAIGVVAANMPKNSECPDADVPVSVLFMNGTDDPLAPYEGGDMAGNRGEIFSVDESIAYWVNRNNTADGGNIEVLPDINNEDNSTVEKQLYSGGANGTEVALYRVIGGGHNAPSIQEQYSVLFELIVGKQNHDIEMADEVWNFFRNKSK